MPLQISEIVFLTLLFLWVAGIIIWIGFVIYLKVKWLSLLEYKLDDGIRFYSLNMFLAGQGVLQYGTVFLSSFHAKRYGMLEKRESIPKHVQKLFMFSLIWFLVSIVIMVASVLVLKFYVKAE